MTTHAERDELREAWAEANASAQTIDRLRTDITAVIGLLSTRHSVPGLAECVDCRALRILTDALQVDG